MKRVLSLIFSSFFIGIFAQMPIQRYYADLALADSLGSYNDFIKADSVFDKILYESDKNPSFPLDLKCKVVQRKAHYYLQQERNDESLDLLLKLKANSSLNKYKNLSYLVNLSLALIYEKNNDLNNCAQYLKNAKSLLREFDLDSIASKFYVRAASYHRYNNQKDSAKYYANKAYINSKNYNSESSYKDANLLLGILLMDSIPHRAVYHFKNAMNIFEQYNDTTGKASMCNNLATVFLKMDNLDSALYYNTIAINSLNNDAPSYYYGTRSNIKKQLGDLDSALYYANKANYAMHEEFTQSKQAAVADITEKYQNASYKKTIEQQEIQSQKQIIAFTISIISAIVFFFLIIRLYVANQKFKREKKFAEMQSQRLAKSLKKQEILFSELHHRVKNNLQIISNILELQTEQTDDEKVAKITSESQNRLKTMALIHDTLYSTDNFKIIDFQRYLETLLSSLSKFYNRDRKKITYSINVRNIMLNMDSAMSLGLIINEIATNSIKHAFKDKASGEIKIYLQNEERENPIIVVEDNGNGLPHDFDIEKTESIGIGILKGLVRQIGADLKIISSNDGLTYKIKLNSNEQKIKNSDS